MNIDVPEFGITTSALDPRLNRTDTMTGLDDVTRVESSSAPRTTTVVDPMPNPEMSSSSKGPDHPSASAIPNPDMASNSVGPDSSSVNVVPQDTLDMRIVLSEMATRILSIESHQNRGVYFPPVSRPSPRARCRATQYPFREHLALIQRKTHHEKWASESRKVTDCISAY